MGHSVVTVALWVFLLLFFLTAGLWLSAAFFLFVCL